MDASRHPAIHRESSITVSGPCPDESGKFNAPETSHDLSFVVILEHSSEHIATASTHLAQISQTHCDQTANQITTVRGKLVRELLSKQSIAGVKFLASYTRKGLQDTSHPKGTFYGEGISRSL